MAEGTGTAPGATRRAVFVSYASEDVAGAQVIVGALERASVSCWIAPRDVEPGALYADEIVGAINDCRVVVLLLSEHSAASDQAASKLVESVQRHLGSTTAAVRGTMDTPRSTPARAPLRSPVTLWGIAGALGLVVAVPVGADDFECR